MKELTIEEKAKRYDEAIKVAEPLYKAAEPMSGCNVIIETLFPELKESEDEKIRKALIKFFEDWPGHTDWIAWLEKQGEIIKEWSEMKMNNIQTELQEMVELKQKTEQGEQKPVDKVEPKFNFNVGQWIVATGKCVYCVAKINGFNVTVIDVENNEYIFPIDSLNDARLWTIQDAKDGDVLATLDHILIFEKLLPKDGGVSYCHYDFGCSIPQFNFNKDDNWYFGKEAKVYPATKEQRDTLMKAMTDAGYTFDFEKKELKKIEQKPTWSEEDEKLVKNLISTLSNLYARNLIEKETKEKYTNLLKSLKDRVVPQSKQEWSEEDKNMLQNILECLKKGWRKLPTDILKYESWLKSLGPQNRWKPSEEQMKALYDSIPENVMEISEREMLLNELYKDLKKL